MHQVRFAPGGATAQVAPGTTLLEAARLAGLDLDAPCNGRGTCGKCKVHVAQSAPSSPSEEVLACAVAVHSDLHVQLPERHQRDRVLLTGQRHSRPHRPQVIRTWDPSAGHAWVYSKPGTRVPDLEEGGPLLGAAVDIGTTTLVVSLVDLEEGTELATVGSLNPQTQFGHDVLTRIHHASEPGGLESLHRVLVDELNRLLEQAAAKANTSVSRIQEIVLSGNTTMLHLVAKVSPEPLGKYPYTPSLRGGNSLLAAEVGLILAPHAQAYLPPVFDGFVGADITSGILVTDLHHSKGAVLFIDVGTNGEMVLAVDGHLVATSTAAGPAFEGMNITFGMRATSGAIERVSLDQDGELRVATIGNVPAIGICGSGLVEAVGQLLEAGVIDASGRFAKPGRIGPPRLAQRVVTYEGRPAFQLSGEVVLTQKDVRQVQLAKGAVRAGIEELLRRQGLAATDIDRVLVAGSFGAHLTVPSLVAIGLLPPEVRDRVEMVGNTSRTGAEAFLLDREARQELLEAVQRADTVDLAHAPAFEKVFVECLAFPTNRVPSAA